MLVGVFRISVNEVKTLDKKRVLEINFCLTSEGVYDENKYKKDRNKSVDEKGDRLIGMVQVGCLSFQPFKKNK